MTNERLASSGAKIYFKAKNLSNTQVAKFLKKKRDKKLGKRKTTLQTDV